MSTYQPYDYILNLSAMKHVRSERDEFTLLRLLETNILQPLNILKSTKHFPETKHFCVSSDKAANPANMMGASKCIMEMSMWADPGFNSTSMARFANVEFSDGSLPYGFINRIAKRQPISAPTDVRRYFVTKREAGELCLLTAILGNDKEIFVPKHAESLTLESFSDIAIKYLKIRGLQPAICATEEEARAIHNFDLTKEWPCYFFESETTGEKAYEEFYTIDESLDLDRFDNIAVINYQPSVDPSRILKFHEKLKEISGKGSWSKEELVDEVSALVSTFQHVELNKNLDEKM
jgi:FlaA1/EpsC-like NDP-sugar epimerase